MGNAFFEPNRYKLIGVINQIHQYPANEKWIAISQDSLNLARKKNNPEFYNNSESEHLFQMCKNQNIGLLVISRRTIKELSVPKYVPGNFLDCYAANQKIRRFSN